MVNTRRELFNIIGLTSDTRYIIHSEGCAVDPQCLVSIDSSYGNIKRQIAGWRLWRTLIARFSME